MIAPYQYNSTTKRIIAVFGTLFNNISIGKVIDGKMQAQQKVPIEYSPRLKFMAAAAKGSEGENNTAVTYPRMGFEMSDLSYDPARKALPRTHASKINTQDGRADKQYTATPWNISMTLSIAARNSDDALQVVEQILPYFQPEMTLAIKDLEYPGSSTKVPFVLNDVAFTDDYEGDLENSRRTVIWSLSFTIHAKFTGIKIEGGSYITNIDINFDNDGEGSAGDPIRIEVDPPDASPADDYEVTTTFGYS